MRTQENEPMERLLGQAVALQCVAAMLFLAACKSTPSPTSSARTERAMSGGDASRKLGEAMKGLMESVQNPPAPYHLSYKSQRNLNPKFPQNPSAKPDVGPLNIEADVTAEELGISETKGTKKTESKAKKSDQLGWAMAQLELTGALLEPSIAMAFGGAVAQQSGSETAGGVAADRYDFDSSTATGSAKVGMEMAMAMLGGKIKFNSVKGSAWVDKASGRLVKFNIDSDLSDKAGNSWKEHSEAEVQPK